MKATNIKITTEAKVALDRMHKETSLPKWRIISDAIVAWVKERMGAQNG